MRTKSETDSNEDENVTEEEEMKEKKEKISGSRVLLGFRDFVPSVDGKSVFANDYDDVNALLDRVNAYLFNRATPAKLLALQTLVKSYIFIISLIFKQFF